MPAKGNKCCCTRCPEHVCIETPDLREQCEMCDNSEVVDIYQLMLPDGLWFNCCPNINNEGATPGMFFLQHQEEDVYGCTWEPYAGNPALCDETEGETFYLALVVEGLDPGDVTLTLTIILDGDTCEIVYKNPKRWNCLCANEMQLDADDSTCDLEACNPAPYVCLVPIYPCCSNVEGGLPEHLLAVFTNLNDCECIDGVEVDLHWDPVLLRWTGDGDFCGRDIHLEWYCWGITIPPTQQCDHFALEITMGDSCIVGTLTVNTLLDHVFDCSCDPFHARTETFSANACCDPPSTMTGLRVDIIEPP